MRSRIIHPEAFRHEALADLEQKSKMPLRWYYAGLWCVADREGRFEWRPRRLRAEIAPYDSHDFEKVLEFLASGGFIVRYEVDGEVFGLIPRFARWQRFHQREAQSELPAPPTLTDEASPRSSSVETGISLGSSKDHPRCPASTSASASASTSASTSQTCPRPPESSAVADPCATFVEAWNQTVKGRLPCVSVLSEHRKRLIRGALAVEADLGLWRKAFDRAASDDFLAGRTSRQNGNGAHWRADLDFLLRKDQIAKTLDRARSEPLEDRPFFGMDDHDRETLRAAERDYQ